MSFVQVYGQDLWAEERIAGFHDVLLGSSDKPADGKLYTMYHGTTVAAAESIIRYGFRPSSDGMLGLGVYVSRDINKARRYPLHMAGQNVVLRLRVNVGKVICINYQGHPLQKSWQTKGYDTAWVPPMSGMVGSGLEEDCIYDPRRIKIINVELAPSPYLGRLQQLIYTFSP